MTSMNVTFVDAEYVLRRCGVEIKNLGELKDFVNICKDGGTKQALVIGGSSQPIGDFHCSLQLLETGLFNGFKIGIAGHPDGSPDISEKDLEKAMIDKKIFADYIRKVKHF